MLLRELCCLVQANLAGSKVNRNILCGCACACLCYVYISTLHNTFVHFPKVTQHPLSTGIWEVVFAIKSMESHTSGQFWKAHMYRITRSQFAFLARPRHRPATARHVLANSFHHYSGPFGVRDKRFVGRFVSARSKDNGVSGLDLLKFESGKRNQRILSVGNRQET